MARTALVVRSERSAKFRSRRHKRCDICGRRRGYMRLFGICRICFRKNALNGNIPGISKESW